MSWLNRLTGEEADFPLAPLVSGQWLYVGAEPLGIRKAEAQSGDALLAGPDGSFHLPGLTEHRPDPNTVADRDAIRTLNLMGEAIRERVQGKSWLEWLVEPPLMQPVGKTLDPTELEREMVRKLGHLEAVCKRPRMHLKLEEERQPVSRCKRPARRAAEVLAAHSEDWDRKTLWGIRPKRVLGMVRDDLYDLYENRVAVSLVDLLDRALVQRIREVRRILSVARGMDRWVDTLARGHNHWRAQRVCSLWGDLWQAEGLRQRAEDALARITRLRRRVLGLRDSRLYERIGGHRRSVRLRMTNVLTHDELYRAVAELWMAWERHERPHEEDPQAIWDREQRAATAMSLHAVLVVVRALEALRLEPNDVDMETAIRPGCKLSLRGPCGPLLFEWREDLSVVLQQPEGSAPLRIVALPAMPEASLRAGGWLSSVPETSLLVLHLDADKPLAGKEVRSRLNGPGPMHCWPQFAPIAPWQLESVERVARAIRWYAWKAVYQRYPPVVRFPAPGWKPPGATPAWVGAQEGALTVIEPPHNGADWPELGVRLDEARRDSDNLRRRLSELDRKNANDRKYLKKQLADVSGTRGQDEAVIRGLRAGANEVRQLLACPVCPAEVTGYDFKSVRGRFRVKCDSCQTTWGLRDCAACDQTYPFIDFPDNEPGAEPLDVDERYGCDVLAFPVESGVHLCTCCGERSDRSAT